MIILEEEDNNLIILASENKFSLFYDMFGLLSFATLGLVLINPNVVSNLEYGDLMSGWFTSLLGSLFCLLMLFTKEHTRRWIFNKKLSCFIIEHQRINGCRRFEFPLEQIESIKISYLSNQESEIIFPDLKPVPISIGMIPTKEVYAYVKVLKNFLDLND